MNEIDLNGMCTDFGNEVRLKKLYAGEILYDGPNETWYIWNQESGKWEPDKKGKINEMTKEMIRGILLEAEAIREKARIEKDKDKKKALEKIAESLHAWGLICQKPARVDACLKLLQSSKEIATLPEDFNRDNHLFNCENGTLNLNTMELLPHNKDHRITFSCGWKYDPKATCPKFEAFILRLFKNHPEKDSLIGFVQMAYGYALSGNTDKQLIIMNIGSGNNGKSVLGATMAATFGDYAANLNGESLTTMSRGKVREDIAKLVGKRFVNVSESGKGSTIDEELIKHITGGSKEPLSVRNLYGSSFNFYPRCKIFWSFNHLPKVSDMTASIWKRIKAVPYMESIPESEKREMNEIVLEHDWERSGILNWLLAGYKNLMKVGNFDGCAAVKTRTDQYREDVDILGPFLETVCERWIPEEHFNLPPDAHFRVKANELYDCYLGWAFENGYTRPKSLTDFGREITERMGRENKVRAGTGYFYHGLRIRDGMKYENPRKIQMQKMLNSQ